MQTHTTPVLTDRVPYTWEELKVAAKNGHAAGHAAGLSAAHPAAMHDEAALFERAARPAATPAAPAAPAAIYPAAPSAVEPMAAAPDSREARDALKEELVETLIPMILERVHAQVSIMIDMTMRSAASKIRADFDQAVEKTVRSAVEHVVREKL